VPLEFIDATEEELDVAVGTYGIPYDQITVPYDPSNLQMEWAEGVGTGNVGARGWHFLEIQSEYAIFVNEYFVPLGFTYNNYIAMDDLMLVTESDRAGLLMRGVGLNEEQVEQYGHLFSGQVGRRTEANPYADPYTGDMQAWYQYKAVSYEQYVQDCNTLRATASYYSEADSSGFTVKMDMPQEDLVFFGVPYDEGFTATVNGVETEVLKVSGGMMAVYAPAGDNTIVFKYKTPGMQTGAIVSVVCVAVLVAYVVCGRMAEKKAAVEAGDAPSAKKPGAAEAKSTAKTTTAKGSAKAKGSGPPAKEKSKKQFSEDENEETQ
jgi:hypothetical protein